MSSPTHEVVGYTLIAVGVAFDLAGTIGLVRLPDVYNRLQAATKCVTLGTCLILIGAGVVAATGEMISRTIICAAFVLLTSPVGAHALARGAYKGGVPLWPGSVCDEYRKADSDTGAEPEEEPDTKPATTE
jgi:multicomponent Na+:H+ antiporter subunit G